MEKTKKPKHKKHTASQIQPKRTTKPTLGIHLTKDSQSIPQEASEENPKEFLHEALPTDRTITQKEAKIIKDNYNEFTIAIFKGNPTLVGGRLVCGDSTVRVWETNFKGVISQRQSLSWQFYEGDYERAKQIYDRMVTTKDITNYLFWNDCPTNIKKKTNHQHTLNNQDDAAIQ